MDFAENFISGIISVVVAIICLALVAVPIINQAIAGEEIGDNLESILTVIPIFLGIAVLYAAVRMFLTKKGQ